MIRFKVSDIAQLVGGETEGDDQGLVTGFAPLDHAAKGDLSFLSNEKYAPQIYSTQATAVLVSRNFQPQQPVRACLIKVDDVYTTLSQLMQEYASILLPGPAIEQPSYIATTAHTDDSLYLGAFAYIGERVRIGKDVKIFPQAYIGNDCTIGDGTIVYAGAKIYHGTRIGKGCIVHSGAVIGSDGFGFAPQSNGMFQKIPQTGNVVLEDYVEIGANTTIDRATFTSTTIHSGVKLDNLIQVAHNVVIGENTVIAAQTGISGSTKIGRNCMIGGQAGIVGHISIADGTQIGAQTGIPKSITETGTQWFGYPALPAGEARRVYAAQKNLPKMARELNELIQVVNSLKHNRETDEQ